MALSLVGWHSQFCEQIRKKYRSPKRVKLLIANYIFHKTISSFLWFSKVLLKMLPSGKKKMKKGTNLY